MSSSGAAAAAADGIGLSRCDARAYPRATMDARHTIERKQADQYYEQSHRRYSRYLARVPYGRMGRVVRESCRHVCLCAWSTVVQGLPSCVVCG